MTSDTAVALGNDLSQGPGVRTGRRGSWLFVPLAIFAATRIVDGVLLVLLGRSQFSSAGLPVAPGRPPLETGRSYNDLVANWDGQWFRYIVEHGYPHTLPVVDGVVQANTWAFYPLYPSLVKIVTLTGLPFGAAASAVSLLFGAAAMCLLYRMLEPGLGGFGASLSVLALCVAPAGVIWQAAYGASLSLFLVLVALWALRAGRYGLLVAVALALSMTRPIVLPLAALVALHWWARYRRRATEPFTVPQRLRLGGVVAVTGASVLLWPLVAALVTQRWDAFYITRKAWTPRGSAGWQTWLVVLTAGVSPALTVMVVLALAALLVALFRPAARRWGSDLRSWGLLYSVFLLFSTRPTTSIFRYGLLSIVPWWPFPEIGQRVTSHRDRSVLFGVVLALGVLSQIVWMRWYFIIGPDALSFP